MEDKGGPWVTPHKLNVTELQKSARQFATAEVSDF
jgi:hypothetical protein